METLAKVVDHVYLASPMTTYFTPRYDRMLAHAQRHFAEAELIAARGLYASTLDWLHSWPTISPTLTALIFFTDREGWIGRGVWVEVKDTLARHLPVWWLTNDGVLHDWDNVQLSVPDEQDWRRFLRVTLRDRARTRQ